MKRSEGPAFGNRSGTDAEVHPDEDRSTADREVRLAEIVFPHHCNHLGTLFGGQALAWMDKAAFLASSRYARHTTVTARTDRIDFKAPIRLGDTVEIVATVRSVGHSSMAVVVTLLCATEAGGPTRIATTGSFVMVAVDGSGNPIGIRQAAAG